MGELTLSTPAILFPTVSLLVLAYTNRYVAISNRIRSLHTMYMSDKKENFLKQIKILKKRIDIIRNMQILGLLCVLGSAMTMFLIYYGFELIAPFVFGGSLLLLISSLALSVYELFLSTKALEIQLEEIVELREDPKSFKLFNYSNDEL